MLPYFGYARQDRKPVPASPISAKLVANMITKAGADRILTTGPARCADQGFFDIPTDNLFSVPVLASDVRENYALENITVVSPCLGGVVRARSFAKRIEAPLATSTSGPSGRIGSDERDRRRARPRLHPRRCTSSIWAAPCAMQPMLRVKGATSVTAYITHGVLSGGAGSPDRPHQAEKEPVITNSIQPTSATEIVS